MKSLLIATVLLAGAALVVEASLLKTMFPSLSQMGYDFDRADTSYSSHPKSITKRRRQLRRGGSGRSSSRSYSSYTSSNRGYSGGYSYGYSSPSSYYYGYSGTRTTTTTTTTTKKTTKKKTTSSSAASYTSYNNYFSNGRTY